MAYYAITNQEFGVSRKSGAEMITLTLIDIETRDSYRSYIDSSMDNFCLWEEIITHPERGYVVTGLKKKRSYGRYNHEILNADCDPVIVAEYPDVKQMERNLRKHWAKIDFKQTPFGKLYGQE